MIIFCGYRQECLRIGKVYTNRTLESGMTVAELQEKIKAKDPQVIGCTLYCEVLTTLCLNCINRQPDAVWSTDSREDIYIGINCDCVNICHTNWG